MRDGRRPIRGRVARDALQTYVTLFFLSLSHVGRWVLRDGVSLSHAVSSCAACGGARGRVGRLMTFGFALATRVRHSQAVHSARVGTPRPHSFFFSPFIPRVAVFMYLFSSAVRRSARPAPSPGCRSRPTLRDAAVRRASCRLTRFTRRTTRHRGSGATSSTSGCSTFSSMSRSTSSSGLESGTCPSSHSPSTRSSSSRCGASRAR
jgi:hypothetical protein